MSERAKYMGKLAETELNVGRIRLKIDGLVKALRDNLDPTVDAERLPGELIGAQALELSETVIALKGELATVAKLREILG